MHIAFVNLIIEYYSPNNGGAISTWVMQQARRLEARGHRVSVLTRVGESPTYDDAGEVIPVDIRERHEIALPRRAWSKVLNKLNHWDWPYYDFYTRSIQQQLRKLNPEAVVCFNDLRIPCYVRRALPQAKVWVRLSNEVATRQRSPYQFDQDLDGYFPVSDYIRRWIETTYGVNRERSVVIVNGCDAKAFYPARDSAPAAEGRLLKVLFVGRINHDKGPDLAVQAVRDLRGSGQPIELTVVGSTWFDNNDRALSDPYCVGLKRSMTEARVRHLGHVTRDRIPELYREHDVAIIPSRWQEPCPQVLLESMASGCAVIASDRGGIPEAMGDAGILIDPDRPGSVQEALKRFLDDPGLLQPFKQRARERALALPWDRVTDRVEAALTGNLSAPVNSLLEATEDVQEN